jgi:hypothetical protein
MFKVNDDVWVWDGKLNMFVNTVTGEEMDEDSFYELWNNC